MKRAVTLICTAVLAASMMFTGCGSKKDNASASPTPVATSATTDDGAVADATPSATPDSSPAPTPDWDTIGDANTSDVIKEIIALSQDRIKQAQTLLAGKMDVAMTAKGNSIIYTYKYLTDIDDLETTKANLETKANDDKATFSGMIATLKEQKVEAPSIVVSYYTKDGAEIFTKEFKE